MKKINHIQRSSIAKRLVTPALVAVTLLAVSSANAVIEHGNPYTPPGAGFSIFAEQNVNLSTGNGQGGTPQVNENFEDTAGLGVQYTNSSNMQVDFGIGLYDTTPPTTGLKIVYNQGVLASSITARLSDFDLMQNSTTFNYAQKVAPGILLLGPSGNVIANALPQDIHLGTSSSAFTWVTGFMTDTWDLSFHQLLINLGMADTAISGFVLYADHTNGETANSDPYFLRSATNGITTVPESGAYLPVIAALVFGLMFYIHALCEGKKAPVTG
jgi:hypothetical protein